MVRARDAVARGHRAAARRRVQAAAIVLGARSLGGVLCYGPGAGSVAWTVRLRQYSASTVYGRSLLDSPAIGRSSILARVINPALVSVLGYSRPLLWQRTNVTLDP